MGNNDATFVSMSHSTILQDINSRCMQYFNVCALRRLLKIEFQINISMFMTKIFLLLFVYYYLPYNTLHFCLYYLLINHNIFK